MITVQGPFGENTLMIPIKNTGLFPIIVKRNEEWKGDHFFILFQTQRLRQKLEGGPLSDLLNQQKVVHEPCVLFDVVRDSVMFVKRENRGTVCPEVCSLQSRCGACTFHCQKHFWRLHQCVFTLEHTHGSPKELVKIEIVIQAPVGRAEILPF